MAHVKVDTEENDLAVMATASDASLCKWSASSLGYTNDPYIIDFVKAPSRRMPIINRGYFARVNAIDTLVKQFLQANENMYTMKNITEKISQIIVLGAGLDTLYYRLKEQDKVKYCDYFEVDFPSITSHKIRTIKRKKKILSRLGYESSEAYMEDIGSNGASLQTKSGYHIVPCDLRNLSEVEQRLEGAGIQKNIPTLVISECVFIYMDAKSSDQILAWSSNYFQDIHYVIYEQILPDDAFGRVMVENIRARGCELRSIHDYPSIQSQIERFQKHDFEPVECWDMNDIYYKYLDKVERERIEKLEIFDEVEEFHLLQAHYCMVVANKCSTHIGSTPLTFTSNA